MEYRWNVAHVAGTEKSKRSADDSKEITQARDSHHRRLGCCETAEATATRHTKKHDSQVETYEYPDSNCYDAREMLSQRAREARERREERIAQRLTNAFW